MGMTSGARAQSRTLRNRVSFRRFARKVTLACLIEALRHESWSLWNCFKQLPSCGDDDVGE